MSNKKTRLLMIDTSSEFLVLAARNKKGEEVFFKEKIGNRQSEFILPEINRVLTDCELKVSELELIAYNQGPGSFTGLRIGASVALALAYSNNCPLLPLSSFFGYLAGMRNTKKTNAVITLDARLGQIYVAGMNLDNFTPVIAPCLINPEELGTLLQQNNLSIVDTAICNNGLLPYLNILSESQLEQFMQLQVDYPDGKTWLNIIDSGIFTAGNWLEADLLYLRNKVALNLKEQKQARND